MTPFWQPEAQCPACRKRAVKAHLYETGQQHPNPNDLTICMECGSLVSFTADMGLRLLRPDELDYFLQQDEIRKVLLAFAKLKGHRTQ